MGRSPAVEIGQLTLRMTGTRETGRGVASRLGPLLDQRLSRGPGLRLAALKVKVPQPPGGDEAETAAAVADAIADIVTGSGHA